MCGRFSVPNSPFAPPGRFPKNAASGARHNKIPAWFAEAVACHQAGRFGRAVELYRQILQCAPGLPEVHNNLGAALAALGRLSDATRSYRRALLSALPRADGAMAPRAAAGTHSRCAL
jgi:Flp pilus assembly protein TadD